MITFCKHSLWLLLIGATLLFGCIKFDDPPVNGDNSSNFTSPCSDTLIDNEVFVSTTSGFPLNGFTIDSPVCAEDGLDYSSSQGSLEIILSEPVSGSRTYQLSFFGIEEGEAQIKFDTPSIMGSSFHVSTTGTLYVNAMADGSYIMEWCDVNCQSQLSSSRLLTSGRVVCE